MKQRKIKIVEPGTRMNHLVALDTFIFYEGGKRKITHVKCICDCGKEHQLRRSAFVSGITKSCGCITAAKNRHLNTKHGMRFSTEYRSYIAAKNRCTNPKNDKFHLYGQRGIEFRFNDFNDFFDCLGEKPKGTTLDRIDSNGHYEKGNVRWADNKTQSTNRRISYRWFVDGVEFASSNDVAKHFGVPRSTAHSWFGVNLTAGEIKAKPNCFKIPKY